MRTNLVAQWPHSKTTTTATLAQGLSLRGHKVLVIDTDPQGSLTERFGVKPSSVEVEETVLPLYQGEEETLDYAVRPLIGTVST